MDQREFIQWFVITHWERLGKAVEIEALKAWKASEEIQRAEFMKGKHRK